MLARFALAVSVLFISLGSSGLAQEPDLKSCSDNLLGLARGVDAYVRAEGRIPLNVAVLKPGVLSRLPVCPTSGLGYAIIPTGKEYRIYCQGKHHAAEGAPPDHPSYRSATGLERFELSTKYARGKRVEIFGYTFDLPHGYLKAIGGGQRPVQLVHQKEQSVITCQPTVPPETGLDWPEQVAASLSAQGYQVTSVDRVGRYGFLTRAVAGDQGLGLIIDRAGPGRYYEVVFRGDSRRLVQGCRTITNLARSLRVRR